MCQDGPVARRGFTLVELLVVMAVMMILATMVTAAAFAFRRMMQDRAARLDMRVFGVALAAYHRELGHYPPDDYVPDDGVRTWTSENGMNEAMVYYTCSKLRKGANFYGPYAEIKDSKFVDRDGDGYPEYPDPWGSCYLYAENASDPTEPGMNKRSYDIVSLGRDRTLGGTMSPASGYVSLGVPEEEDNHGNWSD